MRKILFRGKEKTTGKWAYGNYYKDEFHTYITWNRHDALGNFGDRYHPVNNVIVDEKTIGQFIGLCDKNKKEIFEGDIIECAGCKSVVEFGEWNCGCCGDIYGYDIDRYEINRRVIGNVYDNPGLLEGV